MHQPKNQDKGLTLREKIQSCASWPDLIELFYPGRSFGIHRRNSGAPADLYQDPVLCRLYDALHQEERANYLRGVVQELKPIVMNLSPRSTVAEVGCGPGFIILGLASDPEIARLRLDFVGYDPSPEMISIANEKRCASQENTRISFFVGTTESIPAAHLLQKCSLLICRNVLSWIPYPESEFNSWSAALPPNAQVYLRDLRRDLPFAIAKQRILDCIQFQFHRSLLSFPPASMISSYLRALNPDEVRTSLDAASLSYVEHEVQSGVPADAGRPDRVEMLFMVARKT
jgi:SAM-dependent methyltransferase